MCRLPIQGLLNEVTESLPDLAATMCDGNITLSVGGEPLLIRRTPAPPRIRRTNCQTMPLTRFPDHDVYSFQGTDRLIRRRSEGDAGERRARDRAREAIAKCPAQTRATFLEGRECGYGCPVQGGYRVPARQVSIFVDGCFWHGCPLHFQVPKSNSGWWQEKIEDNMRRDGRQSARLRSAGWMVVRLWEHEVAGKRVEIAARRIEKVVLGRTHIHKERARMRHK